MNVTTDLIKHERLAARKLRDEVRSSILTVLLGEIETRESRTRTELSSDEIVSIIRKLIESCEMTGDYSEVEVLKEFLPAQLTEEELRSVIVKLGSTNIGEVMKHLKSEYQGKFDGKLAASIFNQINK